MKGSRDHMITWPYRSIPEQTQTVQTKHGHRTSPPIGRSVLTMWFIHKKSDSVRFDAMFRWCPMYVNITSLKVLHIEKTPFLLNNNKTAMVLRNKERVANLARTKCALSYSTFLLVLPSVLIVFVDLYHVCHC